MSTPAGSRRDAALGTVVTDGGAPADAARCGLAGLPARAEEVLVPPVLADLSAAVRAAGPFLERVAEARGAAYLNPEGGDVGVRGSRRAVVRHVANYLAAAELGEAHRMTGGLVLDVGSGVGALAAWVADRLGAALHLTDHNLAVRATAAAAFPHATIHAEVHEFPDAAAQLVTGIELIEHVPGPAQRGFVADLARKVSPGGLLVLSTPDESTYPGGWSGYAPHVGCLDAAGLADLLTAATRRPATVWRLGGGPFTLTVARRLGEALANRLWARLHRIPTAAAYLGGLAGVTLGRLCVRAVAVPAVEVTPADLGAGSGLLGVVRF